MHYLISVRDWKRPEIQGIDEAEDRRVRANSERQRKQGYKGEAGRLAQDAEGEAYVADKILDVVKLPQLAQEFVPVARVAEGAAALRVVIGLQDSLP